MNHIKDGNYCITCGPSYSFAHPWDAAHQDLENVTKELAGLHEYCDGLEKELRRLRSFEDEVTQRSQFNPLTHTSLPTCEYAAGAHAAPQYLAEELTGHKVQLCGACLQRERRDNRLRRWESLAYPSHIAEEVRP